MARHQNTETDFWSRVQVGEPDECWPWEGSRFQNGYGAVKYQGRQWKAHRLAYHLCHGEIADSILHTCDNRPCCNPLHLWDGTALENQQDMTAKGRGRVGVKNGMYTHPNKLSYEDVVAIHALKGKLTQDQIADLFGITQSMVSAIQRGARWRIITEIELPREG